MFIRWLALSQREQKEPARPAVLRQPGPPAAILLVGFADLSTFVFVSSRAVSTVPDGDTETEGSDSLGKRHERLDSVEALRKNTVR